MEARESGGPVFKNVGSRFRRDDEWPPFQSFLIHIVGLVYLPPMATVP